MDLKNLALSSIGKTREGCESFEEGGVGHLEVVEGHHLSLEKGFRVYHGSCWIASEFIGRMKLLALVNADHEDVMGPCMMEMQKGG